MARRPSFSVAAAVVTLLAIFGVISQAVRPHIPTPAPGRIGAYPGDYLKQAETQRIAWQPMGTEAFADARRLERPVLLVIGTAASQSGREMDREVFGAPEVQNYLFRNFVCVRVDGDQAPQWLSAYLPLSRTVFGIRAVHQLWALEPTGRLLAALGPRRAGARFDRGSFLRELIRVRKLYAALRETGESSDVADRHAEDLAEMRTQGLLALPDFSRMRASITERIDPVHGGFPQYGFQFPRPHAWRYLLLTGQTDAVRRSMMPALRSPILDLLDGGIYRAARQPDWRMVEFDKPGTLAAETASTLALLLATAAFPDSDRRLAEAALKVMKAPFQPEGEFVDPATGLVWAARQGDESESGRSARSSFSPRRLRELIPDPTDRERVRNALGLRVETNPQMVPMLAEPTLRPVERELEALRRTPSESPRFVGGLQMSVNGTVVARLIEVARLQRDEEALVRLGRLLDRLDAYRSGDHVPHDLDVPGRAPEFLGDYLAFADAALQDYLASGRVVSFESGLAVLRRALMLFPGEAPGEYRVGLPPNSELIPQDAVNPQIHDDHGESATAVLIRLCSAYGRLLLGGRSEDPAALIREALSAVSLFADSAPGIGPPAAGYACAAAMAADDAFAVAVGPEAQRLADELYRVRPTRLIAPAFGPVRPDLQRRVPGIYVIRLGQTLGPLSLEGAAAALPLTLGVEQGSPVP